MKNEFSLPREVIVLSGVASKNKSRAALTAVHFDGKNAMATDGHRMAIVPFDNEELKGTSLNLAEVKKPKAAFTQFYKTGETRFLSDVGPADVVDCAPPDYNAVIPAVSPETHYAIALDANILAGLCKALNTAVADKEKGILTLFVHKSAKLAAIGVVSEYSAGIGVLMPCNVDSKPAFEKFAAISGKRLGVNYDGFGFNLNGDGKIA